MYHIQNKWANTFFFFYEEPILTKTFKVFNSEKDFENNVFHEKIVNEDFNNRYFTLGKVRQRFFFFASGYALKTFHNSQEYTFMLNSPEDEEERINELLKEAIETTNLSGIVVPWSSEFKYKVDIYDAQGETLKVTTSESGNPFFKRNAQLYIPTSGPLTGEICMRLNFSDALTVVLNDEKSILENDSLTERLSIKKPYYVFISALEMPQISNETNAIYFNDEIYNNNYYIRIS